MRFAVAAAVLSLTALLPATPAAAVGTQTIYMNVSGSDSAAGDTPAAAVRTLGRVEQLVAAGPFNHDVEVRLHAGAYLAQQTIWQTHRPGV
ncbi:hypothetical protein B5D80_28075 [Micromonospora wenchangensis]|uniref:Uncharacterized protein n=1 Tax=Micromonospora wenchangensis TaxID=1185415 RepID=A0A246REK2_9ACTN|nr:hypothetical protein [Micromonospora wenchangensis]OWV00289.1 hypothetical protein B5D80_28075 [Micromonospora wenchangensis]